MKIFEKKIEEEVIEKLKTINDLELPISIYDLGLIYKINIENNNNYVSVKIEMTMINSRCNSNKSFTDEIISVINSIEEVDTCIIEFVFNPKWEVTRISEVGLEHLRNADANKNY